jgi:hypothetical protein
MLCSVAQHIRNLRDAKRQCSDLYQRIMRFDSLKRTKRCQRRKRK